MKQAYKFRAYPDEKTEQELNRTLDGCLFLYNLILSRMRECRHKCVPVSRRDTQALIVKYKKDYPFLKEIHSKALQMVNNQIWYAIRTLHGLKKKGRKIGKLRYKTFFRYRTMNFNQSGYGIDAKQGTIKFSGIGTIPVNYHRKIKGIVKGVAISHNKSGKWYVVVLCDTEPNHLPKTGRRIGLDMGLDDLIVDTDGNIIENPKNVNKFKKKVKHLHRELSRKKLGSKNRDKSRIRLATAYEKLRNKRLDYAHKLTNHYIKNYDSIAVEGLDIKGMINQCTNEAKHNPRRKSEMRTRKRHINDACWGTIKQMLLYKAENAGRELKIIDPKGTTQRCAVCSTIVQKDLWERRHHCPNCGFRTMRDYNASWNILKSGLGQPDMLVEKRPLFRRISEQEVVSGQVAFMKQEAPCVSGGSSQFGRTVKHGK